MVYLAHLQESIEQAEAVGVQQINKGSLAVDYTQSQEAVCVVFCAAGAEYGMHEVKRKHDHRTLGIQMLSRRGLEFLSIPAKHDSVTFGGQRCLGNVTRGGSGANATL